MLHRIEGERAGPAAVGILVPPGRRTCLIIRPRAADWDLLLLTVPGRPEFRELERGEAAAGAEAVYRALAEWSAGGPGGAEPVAGAAAGYHVRLTLGGLAFLACPREPGRPYRPLVCPDADSARRAAAALVAALRPPPGATREVYLNTRHFSRAASPSPLGGEGRGGE